MWDCSVLKATLQLQSLEVFLGVDVEPAESLWVRIKDMIGMADMVVGVCFWPPDQEEEVDGPFCKELETTLCLQTLALMWDFRSG